MSREDKELEDKVAYFKDQELLDISNDETGFPDAGLLAAEREFAFADAKPMAPPRLVRQSSSFLGPTPRERQAEFEAQARRQRAQTRERGVALVRSVTAPERDVSSSFPSTAPDTKRTPKKSLERQTLKRNASLSDLPETGHVQKEIPFYRQSGVVPRELKSGKHVKPADNIKLDPPHKQLLKGKVIYFFPNNDVSLARRQRIHKLIQLGAAWVTAWRDDITHVVVDDGVYTYNQVMKVINRPSLPDDVHLVKFDPYIPQCIQFNTLLDPTASRFLVKGAPSPTTAPVISPPVPIAPEPPLSQSSETSLQIKPSKRQKVAQDSQKTDSVSVADSFPPPVTASPEVAATPSSDRVEDSFHLSLSDPTLPVGTAEGTIIRSKDYDDELSKAIEQMKAVSHLPLDDEDPSEGAQSPTIAEDVDSDYPTEDELPDPKPRSSKRSAPSLTRTGAGKGKGVNQSTFQCMNPRATNSTADGNPNAKTIQILEEMGRYYDQMQDTWRTLAYRRGVSVLRKQTTKISTKEQAEALPFIGTRLAEKIEEIVLTDRLRRLDSAREDPNDKVLRLFLGIYGVGLSQAHKWIQAGHRTLEDLVDKVKLTPNQKVGVEHHKDFATRIPRAEVAEHGAYVRDALAKLAPGFEVIVGGSYRRGAKDSGDIDLIITKPGTSLSTMRTIVFETLVPRLFKTGFLKASLATSHRYDSSGTKWLGASCLPSSTIWRRLDLLLVPEAEMGAALIYFTGNDIFNRSMRLLASKKGMRLNQKGLYKDVIRGKNREKLTEGTLIEGRDEKKIFAILGVPWRPPTERIC